MERLQKAIKKARADRGASDRGHDIGTGTGHPSMGQARPAMQNSIWDKLSWIEVKSKTLLSNNIYTLTADSNSNPFDMLRTKVFLLMQQNGWNSIAITSAEKSCGKTTIACNLAFSFSRQNDVSTILLDLDLRGPSVAKTLGLAPEHDLSDVLKGEISFEEQMVRAGPHLAISMAIKPVADPAKLVLSNKSQDVLSGLQGAFDPDILIVDMPPLLSTDYTRAVLKNFDCALIVARAEHTRISQIDVCEREVAEQTNVLGIVLNNCRHVEAAESYDEYYA